MGVKYEWIVEEVTDDEFEDVVDTGGCYDATDALRIANGKPSDGCYFRIGICRDAYYPNESRSWAYVDDNGALPEHFTDAADVEIAKVPKRFHDELELARSR